MIQSLNKNIIISKKKGFTFVEVLIALFVIAVLISLAMVGYYRYIERSKSQEAYINIKEIAKGEEIHKLEKGSYIAASGAPEINALLGIEIRPLYYTYKIVGVTDDNFIVIAERIGEDLEKIIAEGAALPASAVIAMDASGILDSGIESYITGGGLGGGTGGTGGGTGGTAGGGSGGSSGGGGSGGGSSGGGSGGGTTGESGGGSGTGPGPPIDTSTPPVYDADILSALGRLEDNTTVLFVGEDTTKTIGYYYDLISYYNIDVAYEDFSIFGEDAEGAIGVWVPSHNSIYINEDYRTTSPESAIAAVICHEATHADFVYDATTWRDYIVDRYADADPDEMTIGTWSIRDPVTGAIRLEPMLRNSITQEYFCFSSQVNTWNAIKGGDADMNNDAWAAAFAQGEDFMRAQIRIAYAGLDPPLPEY